MIKQLYHLGRKLLRTTGRDIFRQDTLDSLKTELEQQKKQLEDEKAQHAAFKLAVERDPQRAAVIDALKGTIEFQRRYQQAYMLERSIIPLRPERYRYEKNVNNDELLMFSAQNSADFDWLEEQIFKFGYYEKPGVWSFTIDADKRMLAEMIASFKPTKTLDFGCANGPVVQALDELGVHSEGVEISSFALEHAFPNIKSRIHHGDLLKLPLVSSSYDVVSGFDIFEHLNPNKVDACVARIRDLLVPGGSVFTNIPAFGKDEIFGEVFEYYMADWDAQRDGSSYFKTLHVDMHGYPVNGHLIWADTKWWTGLFAKHGFARDLERERALHAQFGGRLYHSRRSFYVFRKT
ncbi:MAG: class I SAM-dependent methyltransferase [Archangiaceae bacterium]|nr:class I SAM-dependent methyltransferase [Archangiaceae bacterium]